MTVVRKQRGFTLVEILIVVIILGILAAIVIPQFTNASEDARKSSLSSQLQSLRSQVALYKLQHRDTPPALATFWTLMTTKTDDSGAASTAATAVGPYFEAAVSNPLTASSTLATAPGATVGWCYNETTGEVHGVLKDGSAITDDGTNAATWNVAP